MCGVYVHVVQLNTSTDAKIQFLFMFIDWFLFTSPKNTRRTQHSKTLTPAPLRVFEFYVKLLTHNTL